MSLLLRETMVRHTSTRWLKPSQSIYINTRSFNTSHIAKSQPKDEADKRLDEVPHLQTSTMSKLFLTMASALGLLNNPSRGDLLSMLTQVSSQPSLPRLLQMMRSNESGRRLLIERPSINSDTVDVEYLSNLERGKFGREWTEWLRENGVGPDGRAEAEYMPTTEEKYLIQRYRESHDFYHLMLQMPVTQLGETVVKYFEMEQMNMPVAGLAAAGGTLRILASSLKSLPRPSAIMTTLSGQTPSPSTSTPAWDDLVMLRELIPWAVKMGTTSMPLITIEWEKCWEKDIAIMRQEMGITTPPIAAPKFGGRRKAGGKRAGWPSQILQHQRLRQQQENDKLV